MKTEALILMLTVQITVTAIAGYYFYRVLTSNKKENKEEK